MMDNVLLLPEAEVIDSEDGYYGEIKRIMGIFNSADLSAVIEACEAALKKWPERAEPVFMLGAVACQMGDAGKAVQFFEESHKLDPDCRDYADVLAMSHTRMGNLSEGLYYAKLATTLGPHPKFKPLAPPELTEYFEALKNVDVSRNYLEAMRQFNQREYALCVDACLAELAINRNHADCSKLLGQAFYKLGNYERAIAALHTAIHLEPDDPMSHVYLGHCLYGLGRFTEGLACHETARRLAPDNAGVHGQVMRGLQYLPNEYWPRFRKDATKWARRGTRSKVPDSGDKTSPAGDRPIRIGYISNEFRRCPEAKFVEPLLKYHDRDRFEVFAYQPFLLKDMVTTRLETQADRWRDLHDIDPVTASYMIKGDALDILVDLSGYGENSQLDLIAARPAPVQVAWLGNPEAAGLPGIDCVLADPVTAERDRKSCLKDQETVVLEHCLVALEPLTLFPDPNKLPASTNGYVTFGGVCDLAQLTPDVAATWSEVLRAVPGASLLLGDVDFISPGVKDRLVELFAHYGTIDRIQFQHVDGDEETAMGASHANFLAGIDIMLDTFPVSGGIETCEALWMGVPVVTLSGNRRASLVGSSILHGAGRPDWVADTEAKFVDKAASLAKDLALLAKVRAGLRDEVSSAPLFDPRSLVRSLEKAYLSILGDRGLL